MESREGALEQTNEYWALPADEVLAVLGSTAQGLTAAEADARIRRYGPNRLPGKRGASRLKLFAKQFASPLIYILLIAGAVSLVLGHAVDASVIAAVLVFNAAIGFLQEYRAEEAIRALQQLARSSARVIRDGRRRSVDAEGLVPGDVVVLEGGDRVPADCRIVEAHGLEADESILTGESTPVSKDDAPAAADSRVPDRASMLLTGTVVTRGRGLGVVTATGASTELGQIAGSLSAVVEVRTPLQRQMSRLANLLAAAVFVLGTFMVAVGYLLGNDLEELFFTAITLAVSAIPEALPVVLTVALAVGVSRMASRNAIIRHLPAVETLGSCTVIGSDKTGTLTQNRMTVRRIVAGGRTYDVEGFGYAVDGNVSFESGKVDLESSDHAALKLTLEAAILANDASIREEAGEFVPDGDPTEVALLVAAAWAGLPPAEVRSKSQRWGDIPFESERQYSAALCTFEERDVMFVKGSPEAVVGMCTSTEGTEAFDPDSTLGTAAEMAGDGLRVLALAYREVDPAGREAGQSEPSNLAFLGLQGMMDPPREEAKQAVEGCQAAGIRVVMITGDHAGTARAIAQDLGISELDADENAVLEGRAISGLSDAELEEVVRRVPVYARVSPHDKLRIVQALQRNGQAVAVTGDGVNDAPALKAADVGIAMGRTGTDVAKEASDMIIADDNFASIHAAVEEGRYSFANVRKATFFTISSGVAEVIAVVSSIVFGFTTPFRPVQILWLNVVTNGVQDVALAFEPGEKRVMQEPPRPAGEGILSRLLYERTLISGIWMALGTLLLFLVSRERGASLEEARSIALTTMVLFQVIHAHNARSDYGSVFTKSPFSNRLLLWGSAGAAALHALVLYWGPAQGVLELEALGWTQLAVIAAVALTIIPVVELHKLLQGRRPVES